MKFTKIPENTFEQLQLNAGVLASSFNVETGAITGLIGATTGGLNFHDAIDYVDFGEDVDNCPRNMLELKKIDARTITISGTFVTISPSTAKLLAGAATVSGNKITPNVDLADTDFTELWWIGDYSGVNEDSGATGKAGFVAIHMMNVLNTGGFQIQSTDRGKGQFAFEFTAHYSMETQDEVPYEIYVQTGTSGT